MTYDAAGNLKDERHFDDSKNAMTTELTDANSILIGHSYDTYGNLATQTDAMGTVTTYTQDSEGLCVVRVETAGHATTRECDRRTGLLSKETQINGLNAAYDITRRWAYDALNRTTGVTEAAGSDVERTTTAVYDDANRMVTVRSPLDTGRSLTTVNHYDELGRVVKTETPDDSGALNIVVDHVYRSVPGDQASYEGISNPYCAASGAGCDNTGVPGWTRTKRDGNGRVGEAATFDGASQPYPWGANSTSNGKSTTSYDAETMTVADGAGKTRKQTTDALGRLVSVVEDPASAAPLTTTYLYDAADKLTDVNQSGQSRHFEYDTLQRLRLARNPESGTVVYNTYL